MTELAPLELFPPPRSRRGEPLVSVRLAGDPQPWVRPKPFRRGGKVIARFTGPFAKWRLLVANELEAWWLARGNLSPIRVPVVVRIVSVFARPAKPPTVTVRGEELRYPWPWTPDRRPAVTQEDADNLAKAVLDCLQRQSEGRPVLADDRLVVDLHSVKVYAAVDEQPCTEVRIWRAG